MHELPYSSRRSIRQPDAETAAWMIRPGSYLLVMSAVLALFLLVNLASILAVYQTDSSRVRRLAALFLFDVESNLATLFNFILIQASAGMVGLTTLAAFASRDRWRWHWLILGMLFVLLAYDEAASLHESLIPLGRAIVPSDGVLYFSWVIFGAAFVLLVGLAYVRFVFALPRRTASLFVIAGALYVGGALGVELWGGAFASRFGMDNANYNLIATVEETLEMTGQIVFGYALLQFLVPKRGPRRG
jgi:hypothetical protein